MFYRYALYLTILIFWCTYEALITADSIGKLALACDKLGTCSQGCTNDSGEVHCSCNEGYELANNGWKCDLVDPNYKLVYATLEEVGVVSGLNTENKIEKREKSYHGVEGLTFDARNGIVYYARTGTGNRHGIYRKSLQGDPVAEIVDDTENDDCETDISYDTENTKSRQTLYRKCMLEDSVAEVVANIGMMLIKGLAFDWITGNIYFADYDSNKIGVCRNDSSVCAVLVEDSCFPESIALHPILGIMFWTCSDSRNSSAIVRSEMDGSSSLRIISSNLGKLGGITVDLGNSRVYWLDITLGKIESSRLDGSDRITIISNPSERFLTGFDLIEDQLYWHTYDDVWSTEKFNKSSYKHHELSETSKYMYALSIFHIAKQPYSRSNPCYNTDCSHVCTIASTKPFTCACPTGMQLVFDNTTCIELTNAPFLVYAFGDTIKSMKIGTIGKEEDVWNVWDTTSLQGKPISSIVFNPINNTLILSDSKKIYELGMISNLLSVLVSARLGQVSCLDIDAVGEILYWANDGTGTIEALALRTGLRILIMDFFNVHNLLVVSKHGLLFVATFDGNGGKVYKMALDGSAFIRLKKNEAVTLAYASGSDRVLWMDKTNGRVRSVSLGGTPIAVQSNGINGLPTDFAADSDWVFCTDQLSQSVYATQLHNPYTGKWISVLKEDLPLHNNEPNFGGKLTIVNHDISDLNDLLNSHECALKNPNRKLCSHACLLTENKFKGSCHCPRGMILSEDGITCSSVCGCSDGGNCLPKEWGCDRNNDSMGGNDEDNIDALGRNDGRTRVVSLVILVLMIVLVTTFPAGLCIVYQFLLKMRAAGRLVLRQWIIICRRAQGRNEVNYNSGDKLNNEESLQKLATEEIRQFREGMPEQLTTYHRDDYNYASAYMMPYDVSFEMQKDHIKVEYDKILGSGQFGCVFKAAVKYENHLPKQVALKMAKDNCPPCTLKGMLSEIKIMMYIGKHPNVVALVGAYTAEAQQGIVYIATELCILGSLQSFLRKQEKNSRLTGRGGLKSNDATIKPTTIQQMLQLCKEIALGIEYLATKNVVHADLASRNVLLTEDKTAKISDFGLSRRMYDYTNYIKSSQEPLPWRWMAMESLKKNEFSAKSDVWSYGITLWEIFTLGDIPYGGLGWTVDFVKMLKNGLRLGRPTNANHELYELMAQCWYPQPDERPNFSEIIRAINDIINTMKCTSANPDYYNVVVTPHDEFEERITVDDVEV